MDDLSSLQSPHNEEALLSAVINNPDLAPDIDLESRDFYLEGNQHTWSAIQEVISAGELPSITTIGTRLLKRGLLGEIGGSARLMELANICPSPLGVESYIAEVRELSRRRKIFYEAQRLAKAAFDRTADCSSTVENAIKVLSDGHSSSPKTTFSSGQDILQATYPPVIHIVPDFLLAGLGILASRAKLGKTTIVSQASQSMCQPGGGMFLNRKVEFGKVLFISLEEWHEAIQERMKDQGWTLEQAANITFVTLDEFRKSFGFLHTNGAAGRLCDYVAAHRYRLVVIDTFAKAFLGLRDQDKNEVVTQALTPLHQLANTFNFALLFIDHHGHARGFDPDPVNDVMSSSAKAQIADTIIGFYPDGPGKRKIKITGRRVSEQEIKLSWDGVTRCYQRIEGEEAEELTGRQLKIKRWLRDNGPANLTRIAEGVASAKERGNLQPVLKSMVENGVVFIDEEKKVYRV